jgi:hypothetical protein
MISIRVKTASLELEMSSDTSESLSEVANEFVRVAQSSPIQSTIHAPIVLHRLPTSSVEEKQAQLPTLFAEANNEVKQDQCLATNTIATNTNAETKTKKRLAKGNGEESQAYNKILDLISKGYLDDGKNFGEITTMLAKVGYNISSKRLADALLRLVREEYLIREGERRKYVYKKTAVSSRSISSTDITITG